MLEAEDRAEVVQGGVNLVKSSVDGVVVKWAELTGVGGECRKGAEQPGTELDEEYAEAG